MSDLAELAVERAKQESAISAKMCGGYAMSLISSPRARDRGLKASYAWNFCHLEQGVPGRVQAFIIAFSTESGIQLRDPGIESWQKVRHHIGVSECTQL